ncbi:MBL fold metallo-hydrolase [Sporosarcina pasteurii]|uniref:Hydroxyacylglutathione hydrolase n=1 Tax=Sporosarcina pasteurii TaxID=1474 RepID=A0A380BYK5_SPOPA|nr:MBL fold metallo-hydrolase [Sporosarcina pasteurii]MDS9471387.1 MBL fold metallo-hydrolase [Sporosarcina pasteurii]QBQ04985.1 MBL fold metallo-hydrolase [Sporosarcina pasteurii]SUJ08496.1 hydroxyacylglutathione hydrolase [Sporosarcina pasteurii]
MLEKLGIASIRVDLPFRLNHVNCFMAEGENGWTIIDTGLNNKETSNLWDDIIQDKNIAELYITHYHPDHYGHAGALQKKTGARVSMSKIDAENGRKAWTDEFINEIEGWYTASGISPKTARKMVQNTADFKPLVTPAPMISHYFIEGEKVPIGNYAYEVIFTPGHADGMVCFYNAEHQVLFSADHILPRITPNISYWFHGDSNPLKSYLASLDKVKLLDADFVIPSHGKPFYGANHRIEEIKKHHDDRLNETLAALSEKSTVNEVYKRLFQWELTIHETRFAIGETLAHLEYLRSTGECTREFHEGRWIYWKY